MHAFEEGLEFLPVNNTKKVEKGGLRPWVVPMIVLGILLVSLVAGFLVWHFQCEYSWEEEEGALGRAMC